MATNHRQTTRRPRRSQQRKLGTFPTNKDIEAAKKLAARVKLDQMMEAKTVDV